MGTSKHLIDLLRFLAWASIIAGTAIGIFAANRQAELNQFLQLGRQTPPLVYLLAYTISGLIASSLWFAIARILENQDFIIDRLRTSSNYPTTDGATASDTVPVPIKTGGATGLIIGIIVILALAGAAYFLR